MGGCNNNFESAGPICGSALPQINQGSTLNGPKQINVILKDRSTGEPVDLSTATAIVANFPATNDAGLIQKTLGSGISVISPGELGGAAILLSGSDRAALVDGIISFVVYVTNATLTNEPCQFLNALQVNPPPFPGA